MSIAIITLIVINCLLIQFLNHFLDTDHKSGIVLFFFQSQGTEVCLSRPPEGPVEINFLQKSVSSQRSAHSKRNSQITLKSLKQAFLWEYASQDKFLLPKPAESHTQFNTDLRLLPRILYIHIIVYESVKGQRIYDISTCSMC